MCRKGQKPNYFVVMGMLSYVVAYFLSEGGWIAHSIKFGLYATSIVLNMIGIIKYRRRYQRGKD